MESETNVDIVKADKEDEEEFDDELEDEEEESKEGEQHEGEEDNDEEEEEEEEDNLQIVKKRRCQRRKKVRGLCFDENELEEEECLNEVQEDEEEEDEEEESDIYSYGSSVLSAITFEWENSIYEFEALCDPGNIETIYQQQDEEPERLDDLGIVRYLQTCRSLSVTPMVRVIRSLRTAEIDLSHRNIDSKSIKAMCAALENNTRVRRFILKLNKLIVDDCACIGRMLKVNEKIRVLDFSGCRIGPEGLELLVENLPSNEVLEVLNLSKCNIRDEGMKILGFVLTRNNSIRELDLSFNKLGDEAAEALAGGFKLNTSVSHLNLSYNNLFNPNAVRIFFRALTAFNNTVIHLNMSWNGLNGPEAGSYIGNFLRRNQSIEYLDLSNNRLAGLAVEEIRNGLSRSASLEVLRIGKNPMLGADTELLLWAAKGCSTLHVLDLEDLWVTPEFVKTLEKIQKTKELEVTYSGVIGNYTVHGPDYPKIILERAQFEAMKPKSLKAKKDFGHLIWTLGDEPIDEKEFMLKVKKFKAKINKELFPELIAQFKNPKTRLIDVVGMRKKYLSIFPDSTPPPLKPKKGEELAPEETKKEEEEPETALKEGKKDAEAGKADEEWGGEEFEDEEGELYIEGFEGEEDEEGELYIEGLEDEEAEEDNTENGEESHPEET